MCELCRMVDALNPMILPHNHIPKRAIPVDDAYRKALGMGVEAPAQAGNIIIEVVNHVGTPKEERVVTTVINGKATRVE